MGEEEVASKVELSQLELAIVVDSIERQAAAEVW